MSEHGYPGFPLDRLQFVEIDWEHRAEHIRTRSARSSGDTDIEPSWATEAALDPHAIVAVASDGSIRIVGWSKTAERMIKVWLVAKDLERGMWWGASACLANRSDRNKYEKQRG
jgi:hypothetical protein